MKAQKLVGLFAITALLVFLMPSNAQTFNQDLFATIVDEPVFCLSASTSGDPADLESYEPKLTGYWVYHISYHVSKKTGEVTRIHWNLKQSHLEDQEGNTYKIVDTGNDNYGGPLPALGGTSYDLWNNINAYNAGFDINYDVVDGWITNPNTTVYVGTFASTFKIIGSKGNKVTFKDVRAYHINGKGDLVVDFDKMSIDCN
jgi:hypothetical protein